MSVSEECKDKFFKKIFYMPSVLSSACQVSKNQKCITVRLLNYNIICIEKKYQYTSIQAKHTVGR